MTARNLLEKPKYTNPRPVEDFSEDYIGHPVVACVWVKPKYTIEHVLTLQKMVQRWLILEHEFVCLTDHDEAYADLFNAGIKPVLVKPDVPGWWQKVKLFSGDLWTARDRVLYLDLDVVITGELNSFFQPAHHTVAIANFGVNYKHSKYNSSVMVFNGRGPTQKIFKEFCRTGPEKVIDALHGDQCWIWRVMVDTIATWPKGWVQSYKYDTRRNGLSPETRIVVYHGEPKPWTAGDPFSKEHYR